MSRIRPIKLLLMNLNQEIPENWLANLSKEQAYQELKELTGQDYRT